MVTEADNDGGDGEPLDAVVDFFDNGNTSMALIELKTMLGNKEILSLGPQLLKLIEMMQLGKVERGSLISD